MVITLLYAASCLYFLWIAPRRHSSQTTNHESGLLILFASQTGFAERLAAQTALSLSSVGVAVRTCPIAHVTSAQLASAERALFIVSTTGEGDAPDAAAAFVHRMSDNAIDLSSLSYGMLALGDRTYSNFCAFGRRIDQWLRHQGARAMFDSIEVDNGESGALRHWQHQIGTLTNHPELADWEAPRYERWQLKQRRLVNPGSVSDACFHIELVPLGQTLGWSAGDILEIDPQNSTWIHPHRPLPHREYSIASLPEDGGVHLLVRAMRCEDGTPGLGSGWLSSAPVDSEIAARVRSNSNFHLPTTRAPLILIGNGTGIAGLRALIKERIARGEHENWLIFGERNRQHDAFYAEEIAHWLRLGHLQRVDYAFSRDQVEKRYVQHLIVEHAELVRSWVEQGAHIYICGSLKGMAPGVQDALEKILSKPALEELLLQGRYRRDVY
jgi:sulfite reductase (NADPH) flavoprotein alpha-component